MNIKGAIFDMDGTLINSLMYWDNLYKRIGVKYFNNESFYPSPEIDKTIRPMIYADAMSHLREYYAIPAEPDEFLSFCENGISEFYRNVATLKDGAKELLESLKKKNIKLCLASATAINEVKAAIEYHGIADYFDLVVSCADIGIGITGTFGNADPNNADSVPGEVYFALDFSEGTKVFEKKLLKQENRFAYKLAIAEEGVCEIEKIIE